MEDSGISIAAGTTPNPIPQASNSSEAAAQLAEKETSPIGSGAQSPTGSANQNSPMARSVDDFTYLQAPKAMVSSLTSKSQYSQVVFHNVSDAYPTDADIQCRYTLTSDVTAQPGDKVAIFKINWTSVSEYVTFERAPQPTDDGSSLSITFKAEKLPKDTKTLYQLCYVTSGNVIAGASTPFNFHVPTESELIAVEDPNDPGMLVFRSRVALLQDDILKKNSDYDQLLMRHRILEDNMKVLKKELDKADAELDVSKKSIAELISQKGSLEIDNKVLQERLMQFQQETYMIGELEEQLQALKAKKDELESLAQSLKIEHDKIKKEYEDAKEKEKISYMALKFENLDLAANVAKHFQTLQENQRTLQSQASTIDCLRQDCERTTLALRDQVKTVESLTNLNEKLNQDMQAMAAERDRLLKANADMETACSDLQKNMLRLGEESESLKKLIHEMSESDDKSQVHAMRAARLEEDKEMLQAQLANLEEHHAKCAKKIGSLTAQLNELSKQCGEGATRRHSRYVDASSGIFDVVKTVASNISSLIPSPEPSSSAPPTPGELTPAADGVDLIKAKLQETRERKAELSSELVSVRHTMAEKDAELAELKQDNAFKKNRIDVLELELRAAKDQLAKLKDCACADGNTPQSNMSVIRKFNENVALLAQLNERLENQQTENEQLKFKVTDLLAKDADLCAELQTVKEQHEAACQRLESYKKNSNAETFDQLCEALDNADTRRKNAEQELLKTTEAKARLEQLVSDLRAESIGKISVDCSRKMQERINSLELEVAELEKFSTYMKQFIHYRFSEGANKPLNCPLCPSIFPPTFTLGFAQHFKSIHMRRAAE
ncbi:Tax1 (human T-cell leukemia virus type I) Hypothetical protein protein 1 [Nesidiocoris tenuis]|uniref:SKICH domain-containing protein n=1 Tax=Nesidiocoris tenuis TaxID=355587 RepID=A0ABN7AZG6_9HEMI|nr:Tax1 (human T-cell leukemia virus type I) Hypothetical protein protein 1 [Nesidiocoris tenuis]